MERRTHSVHGAPRGPTGGRRDGRRVTVPAGLPRSTRIALDAPRGSASAGGAAGEGRQERGGRSSDAPQTPVPSQPRSPPNACNDPHRASSDPGSDAGSVPGQEGREGCWWQGAGGLWWRDQFPLGHGQHRISPPAEPPANPGLSRGSDQRSCPALEQPQGQLPQLGALQGASGATVCSQLARSHQHACSVPRPSAQG